MSACVCTPMEEELKRNVIGAAALKEHLKLISGNSEHEGQSGLMWLCLCVCVCLHVSRLRLCVHGRNAYILSFP